MFLAQHVYGTAQHQEPHAWVVRLQEPFLLAWPESPNAGTPVSLWPRPPFHHPEMHDHICGLMNFGAYRSLTYAFVDAELPHYLFVEEPDGPWAGVLDLRAGLLFVPNNLSILVTACDFPATGRRGTSWVPPEETLAAAQRWHDDFITDPEFA